MKETFTLSDADGLGHAVIVRCHLCVIRRYYRPSDVIKLFGDIPCREVGRRMICATCDRKDYVVVRIERLRGEEMARARFRRLKGIKIVRRPIWVDDP